MHWSFFYSGFLSQQIRWSSFDVTAEPFLDSPPQMGTHLIYEVQLRSSQAGTAINLQMMVNGDTTAGNYHFQRYLTLNGAAAGTEGTSAAGAQLPGSTAVANVYNSLFVIFPWFRNARQKTWLCAWSLEEAANAQDVCMHVQKRQGASVTGALTDPITIVQFSNALGNAAAGTIRRAVVQ